MGQQDVEGNVGNAVPHSLPLVSMHLVQAVHPPVLGTLLYRTLVEGRVTPPVASHYAALPTYHQATPQPAILHRT